MKSLFKNKYTYLVFLLVGIAFYSCEYEIIENETATTITKEVSQFEIGKDWLEVNFKGKNIFVQKADNFYLWGDILIPVNAAREILNSTSENSSNQLESSISKNNSIIADHESLWPNNTISYFFDSNFSNHSTTRAAIHHWELFTTLNFVESTNQVDGDLIIFEGSGCNATVGYRNGKHENSVSIGNICDVDDAIHEFGHVVGLYHEQNRNDRDEHIQVFFDNIIPSFHSQFEKNEDKGNESYEFTPFDFESTMLYSSDAFSIEGVNNSILKLNGSSFNRGKVLSKYDIIGVESIYREGFPKKIAISSIINGNKYLSSENGKRGITSNRPAIGDWETFTVHPIGGSLLALQASNGKFLSINEIGELKFNSRKVGDQESFKAEYNTTINGKFYYTISHKNFSSMFVDDITNEIKIDNSGGGGQDSLFSIEILK